MLNNLQELEQGRENHEENITPDLPSKPLVSLVNKFFFDYLWLSPMRHSTASLGK